MDTEHPTTNYVLKVRAPAESNEAALAVARYLHECGLPHVVAPLRSTTQSLSVQEGRFSLTVYPFLEGSTGVEAGLSAQHWRALGRLVKQFHTSALPPDLMQMLAASTTHYRSSCATQICTRGTS